MINYIFILKNPKYVIMIMDIDCRTNFVMNLYVNVYN